MWLESKLNGSWSLCLPWRNAVDEKTRKALTNPSTWSKGAAMLLFFLLLLVVTPLLMLVSLVGWIGLLINGRTPDPVSEFGRGLAAWYDRTARYLTGSAARRPFPFEDLDCPPDEPRRATSAGMAEGASRSSASSDSPPSSATAGQSASAAQAPAQAGARKTPRKKVAAKKKTTRKKKAAGKKKTAAKKPVSQAADPGKAVATPAEKDTDG
jgi:hypothetical protein